MAWILLPEQVSFSERICWGKDIYNKIEFVGRVWIWRMRRNSIIVKYLWIKDEMKKEAESLRREDSVRGKNNLCTRSQQFLWDLFEKPESSIAARVVSWVSVLFVVISTVAMVLNTMPELEAGKSAEPLSNWMLLYGLLFHLTMWLMIDTGFRGFLSFHFRILIILIILIILSYLINRNSKMPPITCERVPKTRAATQLIIQSYLCLRQFAFFGSP